MNKTTSIIFRLFFIILCLVLVFVVYQHHYLYSSGFILLMFLVAVLEFYKHIQNVFFVYDKTISAILHNDFSADYSESKQRKNYVKLFDLYQKLKANQNEIQSQELVFNTIFNNIETGVVILKKTDNEWNVHLINNYFEQHFKTPKVSKWKYLKKFVPSLCQLIETQNFDEIKTSVQIKMVFGETQTFVLQTSKSTTYQQEYYIILLDSIQNVIEKKQKEAWLNLMQVISHEILNSLTPIQSLSQNLEQIVAQDQLTEEDIDDIKSSVQTILNRSKHLQKFVESYRSVAMLPSPVKNSVDIQNLIENVLQSITPLFNQYKIVCHQKYAPKNQLYIDKTQIEQVLINLFSNCMYALENKTEKLIEIETFTKENRYFISISDNGKGIEKEIEDKIFLPFFTTRKQGAGIGLTLSKNIIEAHGGYLIYQQNEEKTRFLICLI